MDGLKQAFVPGLLAYVGVRAATMFAPTSTAGQTIGGIAGAILGVFLAKKI